MCTGARSHVIHTPSGRGVALRGLLRSKGIEAEVSCLAGTAYDQVEVGKHVNPHALQVILKHAARKDLPTPRRPRRGGRPAPRGRRPQACPAARREAQDPIRRAGETCAEQASKDGGKSSDSRHKPLGKRCDADHLTARVARDGPDILERKAGEVPSVRSAVRDP
jgi:hypothetical protein